MIKSDVGFLSNQEDVTLRMIQSAQVSKAAQISSMCTCLQVSGRSNQNLMSYADDKVKQMLFQQSRGSNFKTNDPIWLVFELV